MTTSIFTLALFLSSLIVIPDGPTIFSQYGPWVTDEHIYFCRNSDVGWYADRLWEADVDGENARVILEGSSDPLGSDFLTCSGTVARGHILYMTSNGVGGDLGISHAYFDGGTWVKTGRISGLQGTWWDTPSIVGDHLYVIQNRRLWRYQISPDWSSVFDGQQVSWVRAIHGTVVERDGLYYYTYATGGLGQDPPTQVWLEISSSPTLFYAGRFLFGSTPDAWDQQYVFTPFPRLIGDRVMIYYAGNSEYEFWWGEGSSIGIRIFDLVPPSRHYIPMYMNWG